MQNEENGSDGYSAFVMKVCRLLVAILILGGCLGRSLAVGQVVGGDGNSATRPAVVSLETQLLFPGSMFQGKRRTKVNAANGRELLTLHSADGTKIIALFSRSAKWRAKDPGATIIYFYGNGMCMNDSLPTFNHFRSLGFNVAMADYQGYGMSDGLPSEEGCYATADALYDHVLARKDIDPKKIVAAGWSLGAAVAIDLANRKPVAGLASFSAFTNRHEMREAKSNRFPIEMLMQSKFDNLAKFKTIQCPIFMAHGTEDALIPFAMMDRLKQATTMPVTAMPIQSAGHNDLFQVGGDGLYERFKVFVNQLK